MGLVFKVYLFFIFLLLFSTESHSNSDSCKKRLPDIINSYQPSIIPVVNFNENVIFFDRKWHPDNIGGIYDNDDIWFSSWDNGTWGIPENVGLLLNTKDSDVLFSITSDDSKALIYGVYNDSMETKISGFSIANKYQDYYGNPEQLNIKNYYNNWENFHGFLSHNSKILILALNRKDSFGKLDLYVSFLQESDGTWSEPKNLGVDINTIGVETAPFLAYDNKTLYFATDNRDGYGKLDLYYTKRLDDSWLNWSNPVNLGTPINTEFDENSIYLTSNSKNAYVVSSDTINQRAGIYKICVPIYLRPEPYIIVKGDIFGVIDQAPFPIDEQVEFCIEYNDFLNSDKFYSISGKSNYHFIVPAIMNLRIKVKVKANNYYNYDFEIKSEKIDSVKIINKNIVLKKIAKSVSNNLDQKKLIGEIYFQIGDSNIDNQASNTLAELINNYNLKSITNKKLIIIGHTDEVGTDEYNFALSLRRARNASNFLKLLGINPKSIKIEWKGKTQPKSTLLSENRRVEIYLEN